MDMLKDTLRLARHYTTNLKKVLTQRKTVPELPIYLPSINRIAWGIKKQCLTIIGARTGNCKSAFALSLAYETALLGKNVLFISLEMTATDILERLFCYESKVDNDEITKGRIEYYEKQWEQFLIKINNLPLMISEQIGRTTGEITELLNMLLEKPDLIVIDHIQEIKSGDRDKKKTIDEYLDFMRGLAIKNNMALIICSQCNRLSQDEKTKEPQLHHLKHSGALEEKADVVYLLHWPWKYGQGEINNFSINLAKNRNGKTGYIRLKYFPEIYRFQNEGDEGPYKNKPVILNTWEE